MNAPVLTSAETRAQRKLREFAHLPVGWHYGGGGPIAQAVLDQARLVVDHLIMSGFSRNDAFPGADGELQITGYYRNHFISVVVNVDGTFDVTHEIAGREHCAAEGVRWPGVKNVIDRVAGEVWGTFDLFTHATGTLIEASSVILHSRSPQMVDCRWLHAGVLRARADRSVRISAGSIPA